MKKVLFAFIFSLAVSGILNAQDLENIFTDRPDQSESPMILYKRFIQFESGVKYTKFQNDAPGESDYSAALPELMIRYGLTKNVELRLNLEYTMERINIFNAPLFGSGVDYGKENYNGFQPPEISLKYRFFVGKDYLPMTALLITTTVPKIGAERYRQNHFNPGLALLMLNDLSDKFDLGYNLGLNWDNEAKTKTGYYTLSLGYSPTQTSSVFIESFTNYTKGEDPDYNIDFGFSFLLEKNMQADFYVGSQLRTKPAAFFGGGFSIRLPD